MVDLAPHKITLHYIALHYITLHYNIHLISNLFLSDSEKRFIDWFYTYYVSDEGDSGDTSNTVAGGPSEGTPKDFLGVSI